LSPFTLFSNSLTILLSLWLCPQSLVTSGFVAATVKSTSHSKSRYGSERSILEVLAFSSTLPISPATPPPPPLAPTIVVSKPFHSRTRFRAIDQHKLAIVYSLLYPEVSMDRPVHGRTWTWTDGRTSMDCYKNKQGIRWSPCPENWYTNYFNVSDYVAIIFYAV
jgi:hypothetical protein